MYETEANGRSESSKQIPSEVIDQFRQLKDTILERTALPWSEHCTECVWPTCYSSCDLYSPREDGRCRRFADGMVRVDCPEAFNSYLLKIRFKRWAKLWAPGNIRLRSVNDAMRFERRDYLLGNTLYQLPLIKPLKSFATQKRYSFKKRAAYGSRGGGSSPTSFIVECYNPSLTSVRFSLTMRSIDERAKIPFQRLLEIGSGFHQIRISFGEITKFIDLRSPFNIELVPNEEQSETVLYFGVMDFVREVSTSERQSSDKAEPASPKKAKCIVWDLDNTVWEGILLEDGPKKLRLRPQIKEILRELDERGIMQSIVSKNNREDALSVLDGFGIAEYFLCPQISWQPKSEGVRAIAQQLNIGTDSLLFVDDSEFELEQVRAVHPAAHVINARDYLGITDMEICRVPVSEESRRRRMMYKVEIQRRDVAETFSDDYLAFLRYCEIKLNIRPMLEENLDRVHELTQRTNQMNFSGNRYEKSILKNILSTPHLDTFVLEVEDRFGSYGIVGFCIVDSRTPLMTDLMFSCRIQSKRVEHAFLTYLLRKYIVQTNQDFYANYNKTPRNAPSGQVFADFGMEEIDIRNGVSRLRFLKKSEVPDDRIITVVSQEPVPLIRS